MAKLKQFSIARFKKSIKHKRTFDFDPADNELLSKINDVAVGCWKALSLKGYVRVDIRLDNDNNPFVLEVNCNPCISDSGGFFAATQRAGYKFTEVVERIIKDAFI